MRRRTRRTRPTTPTTTTVSDAASAPYVPGEDWQTLSAAEAGFDPDTLGEVATLADAAQSSCVMVVRDGRVVVEEYAEGVGPDDDIEIFSATKSVTAVLVGIAQDQGHLSIDEKASTYLTEWVGTESESVTIRDLLTNTSGRYHDMTTDYTDLTTANDRSAFAIGLSQAAEPNTVWVYNNAAIQTLEEVLQRATGADVGDFAEEFLFRPLGMDVRFLRDLAGNPSAYFGLQAGCADMARFGLMVSRQGDWGGEQIVSDEYLAEATTPSTELKNTYGYLFWLNAPGTDGRRAVLAHGPARCLRGPGVGPTDRGDAAHRGRGRGPSGRASAARRETWHSSSSWSTNWPRPRPPRWSDRSIRP